MASLQSLCLMVLATLYVACQGQCIVRTLMPSMAIMEYPSGSSGCSSGSCDESTSSADDLGALLLLARALEMDKANNENKGIDVNALLDSLIHAIVCIAKPESSSGGYSSGFPNSPIASKNSMHSASPSAGNAGQSKPATGSGGSGSPGVTGLLNTVTNTVNGLLDGSGSGGVPEILNSVTGTVDQLLGGGSGVGGLDGVGKTVGGLTSGGGGGSGGSGLGGVTGLVGGITGGSGSKGGLL